jgi:hypothetical protein
MSTNKYAARPATRESIGLLIGLAGGTGSGKTKSAIRMAHGIVQQMIAAGAAKPGAKFVVIDTEHNRAKHYAPRPGEKPDFVETFDFDHVSLDPPFRPQQYADAIKAQDDAGYPVIMVDSASHEWAGEGGILDWHEEKLDEMVKRSAQRDDKRPEWQIRESGKMAAWIEPKMEHKQMVNCLLQRKAHLILCFRAEEKVEMKRVKEGNREVTKIVPKESLTGANGWIPICEKALPFELTISMLLLAANPGIPIPIKMEGQHRAFIPLDKPLTEDIGRKLAIWAAGGTPDHAGTAGTTRQSTGGAPLAGSTGAGEQQRRPQQRETVTEKQPGKTYITDEQVLTLITRCSDNGVDVDRLKKAAGVAKIDFIEADRYQRADGWITTAIAEKRSAEENAGAGATT